MSQQNDEIEVSLSGCFGCLLLLIGIALLPVPVILAYRELL